MFSKACEYAIRAMIYITLKSLQGERASLVDISLEIGSPKAFTGKILQKLVKNDLIESLKGPHGGFAIKSKMLHEMRLHHIVMAIDGLVIYNNCGMGMKECNETRPCPLHYQYKLVRAHLIAMMEDIAIIDMAKSLQSGSTFLNK